MIGPLYETALRDLGALEVEHADGGHRAPLRVGRWCTEIAGDDSLLARCTGPVLDVGSGPGRLTVALAERGHPALGIDLAGPAVRRTLRAGGAALRRDVFAPVPGTGRWRTVLLADGNIGIGGDPVALLRRAGELLGGEGRILVEAEPPGCPAHRARVRLRRGDRCGDWFDWAYVGVDALPRLAVDAALTVDETWLAAGRWFAGLRAAGSRACG